MAVVKKIRATLVELFFRPTKFEPKENVFLNGEDNQYSMEMERVILNSPTAKRASQLMSKYISGIGIDETENVFVDAKSSSRLSDVIKEMADDISIQYGTWVHRGMGVEVIKNENGEDEVVFVPKTLKVLDYNKCRKAKEDDEGNKGRIKYGNFEKTGSNFYKPKSTEKEKWYYPFSNDQSVILSQIRNDAKKLIETSKETGREVTLKEMLSHYRGQVYYLNLTPKYVYAVSQFDAVFNDCDTEYRMSVYSNTMTREGFLGKLAILVSGLDPATTQNIKEDASKWLGSENTGSVYFLEIEDTENLENNFKVVEVPNQYNDDMFTNTDNRVRRNILGSANNLPEILAFSSESTGVFGNSGELYKQAKIIYEEQTEYERKKIEETLSLLGFPCRIKTLSELEVEDENAEQEN